MTDLTRRRSLALLGAGAFSLLAPTAAPARGKTGFENMTGRPTPPLVLPDLDGTPRDLADLKGQVVMLNFWADWCPPCLREIPSLHRAWIILRAHDVELLTVHVGGTARGIRQFMADRGLKFPVLVDEGAKTFKAWPTMGLPTTFVIDRDGKMALAAAGAREWDTQEILDPIRALAQTRT